MDSKNIIVIAPNIKKRWSGVTSTIKNLIPIQKQKINIISLGNKISEEIDTLSFLDLLKLPKNKLIIWHARRNIEMLVGLVYKKIFNKNIKILFTSAAQRDHSKYTKWLISNMDAVIATSAKSGKYLDVPFEIIMHGINTNTYIPSNDKFRLRKELNLPDGTLVGCFGRIRYQKGVDLFVNAMIQSCKKNKNLYGIICGQTTPKNIDYLKELKKKVADQKLTKNILFLGEQPSTKLPLLFRSLDIYVAPQRWEGFGLTPLEAMSSGVPVIASTAGAFEEMVVDNVTGYIMKTEDESIISNHIENLIKNEHTMRSMSINSRKRVSEYFDINSESNKIIELYQKLLN